MNHNSRRSTAGRPRALTDAQIAEVLSWADSRVTAAEKARQLNISTATLFEVIRTRGTHYKQPSPELRTINQHQVNEHRARLIKGNWL